MSTSFFTLPRELRDKVYELCLLREEPIDPWDDTDFLGELSPGLLITNKAINREAGRVLYWNRFEFTLGNPADISAFLERIGRNNAAYIRHVIIEFPYCQNLTPGSVSITENDSLILASIQGSCTSLRTLTTSWRSVYNIELKLDVLKNREVVAEMLALLDTCFRAISSLQEIIVEMYEYDLSDYVNSQIKNYRWTVNIVGNDD